MVSLIPRVTGQTNMGFPILIEEIGFFGSARQKGAAPPISAVVPWRCSRFTALRRGLPARCIAK